jgi:hypothetical protein
LVFGFIPLPLGGAGGGRSSALYFSLFLRLRRPMRGYVVNLIAGAFPGGIASKERKENALCLLTPSPNPSQGEGGESTKAKGIELSKALKTKDR